MQTGCHLIEVNDDRDMKNLPVIGCHSVLDMESVTISKRWMLDQVP